PLARPICAPLNPAMGRFELIARRRGWRWRPGPPGLVGWAHDPDVMAIGISDDGVPRPPEGVIGALHAVVASVRHVGVRYVDVIARRDEPSENHSRLLAGAPRRVVEPGEMLVVDVNLDPVVVDVRVADLAGKSVLDVC